VNIINAIKATAIVVLVMSIMLTLPIIFMGVLVVLAIAVVYHSLDNS